MASTLEEILGLGEVSRVAWYRANRWSYAAARERLASHYPEATARTIEAVLARGWQSYAAGQALGQLPADRRLLAKDIPHGAEGGSGYQYTAHVTVRDPQTGEEHVVTARYWSPSQLTREQAMAEAREAVPLMRRRTGVSPPFEAPDGEYEYAGVSIISIYRS